jgi:DNA-binding SARP family transcriptional activator
VTAGRRAGGAARALAAAAALAVLAAGLPWLMWHVTGWPLPRNLPDLATLKTGLTSRESPRVILDTLTCAGWAVWAVFIGQTAAEAAWQIRHLPDLARTGLTPGRRAAGLSPPRALAAILIGSVLIGILAAARGMTAPAAAQALPRLPAAPAAATLTASRHHERAPASRPGDLYTVREGDNLWDIAASHLGNGEAWKQIWELNKYRPQAAGGELTTPGLIEPGWILRLPAPNGHHRDTTRDTARQHRPDRTPRPAPQPPAGRQQPGGQRHPGQDSHGQHNPAGEHHGRPADAPGEPAGPGISLPSGGLAGGALAAAVTTALALAAVQRRRRYRPGRHITSRLDPAAPPVPPTIAALRNAARPAPAASAGADGEEDDPYGPGPEDRNQDGHPARLPATTGGLLYPAPVTLTPAAPAPAAPPDPAGTVIVGVRDGREVTADITALGGLGLTGPGSLAAARAILAGLLARTLPGSPAGPAEIIIPAADAGELLPGYDQDAVVGRLPGLALTPSLDAALDLAEEIIVRRARIAAAADDRPGPPEPPPPPAVLIAAPGGQAPARIRAILRAGAETGLAGILLDDWPAGATCHIAADGTASSADPGLDGTAMFSLAGTDTTAILALLTEARGDTPADAPAWNGAAPAPASPEPHRTRGHQPPPPSPHPSATVPDTAPVAAAPVPEARPARAPGAATFRVEILGPLRLTSRGTEITGGLRKARELAAFLAIHPDSATGDAISEALWPGSPPGHGRAQRGLALRKLRELLRDKAAVTQARLILLSAGRYRLDPALFSTDVADFQAALDAIRTAPGDTERLAACRAAAALYRGPLADGEGYDWAEPYAEAARRRALDALARAAEILQPADPEQALATLETALAHDPYNEYLYQQIMRLQASAHRPDAVRRTLALLENRLAEIGVTPGTQTRQIAATLLGAPGQPAEHVGSEDQ